MFSLRKKRVSHGWRAALFTGDGSTALALVQQRAGQRPLLGHLAVHEHPTSTVDDRTLSKLLQDALNGRAHASLSMVLPASAYQMVQVEAPDVPAAELRGAVRWKLRDLIGFPVDDATIDVFEAPPSPRRREKMLYAVAARPEFLQPLVQQVQPRARGLDVIDIPELSLRNLCSVLPQQERGVALLCLEDTAAQLLIARQGVLYLTRRIELSSQVGLRLGDGDEFGSLALEVQRSVDFYESHYDQLAINSLVIAPDNATTQQLATQLRRDTSLDISLFDLTRHLELAEGVVPDSSWQSLASQVALGAALRAAPTTSDAEAHRS